MNKDVKFTEWAPWVFSTLLHISLILAVLFGPSLRPTQQAVLPKGSTIDAVVIDSSQIKLAALPPPSVERQVIEEQRKLQERRDELARQEKAKAQQRERDERQKKKREEEEKAAKLKEEQLQRDKEAADKKAALEKAEREKKKADELLAKKQAAEKEAEKKQAAELAKKKAAEEEARKKKAADLEKKKAAELLAKKKAEAAKKKAAEEKKAAAEKKRQEALAAQMAAEQATREKELLAAMGVEEQRVAAVDSGLLDQYIAQLIAKVERNWNRPMSAKPGMECTVNAVQIPGGDVVSVSVSNCDGDDAVKRSIELAVRKASPLPEPPDPTLFSRNINFKFAPDK